jgi:hypothetical protein
MGSGLAGNNRRTVDGQPKDHSLRFSAVYAVSLNMKPKVSFTLDLYEITCEGIFLDFIDGLTDLPELNSATDLYPGDSMIQMHLK